MMAMFDCRLAGLHRLFATVMSALFVRFLTRLPYWRQRRRTIRYQMC